ncbi:MAG: NAD(P)H-hydrate dehydratase [Oscillospiraceae bacterium]|nr:NAD(P)H-hydrate dehydratase [Oscillospiraceae bacterium]
MTAAQTREIDEYAISELKIPGATLMRRAARHIAQTCLELLGDGGGERRAAVLCGAGNNGGDGLGAAAYLLRAGVSTRIFLLGDRGSLSPDPREMLRLAEEYGGVAEPFDAKTAGEYLRSGDAVVIDAIFGTGLARKIEGAALDAIRLINASGARVISADIPSGVMADTGEILGEAVRADITVTFTAAKPGHFLTPGCENTGELRVRGLGIPPYSLTDEAPARQREIIASELLTRRETAAEAIMPGDITLPRRGRDTHKYDYGDILMIAGSVGYTGAPVLAARAATRAGAGVVRLGAPDGIYGTVAAKCSGEIVFPIPGGAAIGMGVWEEISARAERADAVLIGPGLGNISAARELIKNALGQLKCPVILDADGINALLGNIDILDNARAPVILTPHDGEFRRLAEQDRRYAGQYNRSEDIFAGGRLAAARRYASAHGCALILKGYRTITALPDGSAYINTTGGPALAKGGTGDMLAGVLTALAGQGFPIKDACLAAVYLHGLAGDIAALRLGEYSVTAEDVMDALAEAFLSVTV